MSHSRRIERALRASVDVATTGAPPQLAAAIHHAVFPGGARVRPHLCLAVASACGDPCPALSEAAAAAVELVHCASLVHDDLPCFDNASTRRGRSSVHRAFGEAIAVLAGDALIVAAFEAVARAGAAAPDRLGRVIEILARGVSSPHGIIAGQAWESGPHIPVITYRRAKTAALFEAAAAVGAAAAGDDPAAFRAFGERIGEAYQVADDILDVSADPSVIGKPVGRDSALGRPNAARDLGVERSRELLEQLLREALDEMPARSQSDEIRAWAADTVTRLLSAGRPVRPTAVARSHTPQAPMDAPEMAGAERG